jgi:TolB-like protein/Tfp pilus assembly protein PilF
LSLFNELKRRNVIRVGIAYVIGSWLLIQVTETIFPLFGFDDTPARIVVIVLAIGLIPALVFAWIFEMTPEGLKQEKDIDRSQSIAPETGRKLNHTITVALVLALGYFAFDKFVLDPQREAAMRQQQAEAVAAAMEEARQAARDEAQGGSADARSIAVLPFANMSGDPANEPFTLGIHDDLLTHLSRIKSLKTISRTSVLQYRDTTKTIPEIAAELGVSNVLEGGIQRSGNRVRINLQLIDAKTDEHLWAEIYDRELTAENLFAVQGEIATEVAKSLRATLLPAEQRSLGQAPTRSMAAYDLYLLGRHHWNQRTGESIGQARDYFARAIEADPDYVLAYSGLADSYALLVNYGNMEAKDAYPLAQDAIDQAMALDDSVSEVWASRGLLLLGQQKNTEASAALVHAIELDPQNFSAWLWYGNTLLAMRRFEEHIEALQTAYGLEPMSHPVNINLASAYRVRGDFIRSRQHYERVDQLDHLNPARYKIQIIRTYFYSGDIARALAEARQVLAAHPENSQAMSWMINGYLALGDVRQAKTWADRVGAFDSVAPDALEILLVQGDFDEAIVYLEDKLSMLGNRDNLGFLFELFRSAYLGGRIETAQSYLAEYLTHLGGRPEVNPSSSWQWNRLLLAQFWMSHGNASADEPRHGREIRDEVLAALTTLNEQGFEHPSTYYGLALARAMQGDHAAALDELENALERGLIDPNRLAMEPGFDQLRNDERFGALTARLDALIKREQELLTRTELAPYTPATISEPVIVPRGTLKKYEGYYSDGNMLVHFRIGDDGQFYGRPGQNREVVLLASAQDKFYVKISPDFTIKFFPNESGVVTHIMADHSGSVTRYKAVEPPPPVVAVDINTLKRYEGTFAAQRIKDAKDGGADTDIWTAVISVDGDGKVWIDYDNQPRLEIRPYSETEFFMPGFHSSLRFEVDSETGAVDRMINIGDGFEYEFKRQ